MNRPRWTRRLPAMTPHFLLLTVWAIVAALTHVPHRDFQIVSFTYILGIGVEMTRQIWSIPVSRGADMTTPRPDLRDMDGNPMSLNDWGALFEDFPSRVLAEHEVYDGPFRRVVRTLWTGHAEADIHPFGTVIGLNNPGSIWTELRQYDTKEDALAGHREIVAGYQGH